MIITFNIEYRTNWGEEVRIQGSVPELGNWNEEKAFTLHTTDGIRWTASVEVPLQADETVNYTYCIYRNGRLVRKECDTYPRSLCISADEEHEYITNDYWKNISEQQYFYSSAFTECLLPRNTQTAEVIHYKKSIVIKAYCPRLSSNYALAICGNRESLGSWNMGKALLLSDKTFPEWQIELDASKLTYPLEYKFVLYNLEEQRVEEWEQNPNRYLADPELKADETLVISDRRVSFNIPAWKGAGVAMPIFSLKSADSFGIGDFGDLKKMIDWAITTDQKVVQILPINDTTMSHTWMDSYPYNSISIYALHPMYADLNQLGKLEDEQQAAYFAQKQKTLNDYPTMNYEEAEKAKWEYFRQIFRQEGNNVLSGEGFRQFFDKNKEWLQPYAAFSYLRDRYNTSDFRYWDEHSEFRLEEIEKLCAEDSPAYNEIAIFYYLQYQLHCQLSDASSYARQHGIVLKGDIPIGISRSSVEAWKEPYYFNMNGQAGAPPDDFSVNGQNWGFPTYNWDAMEKDGYNWWMKRFRKMAEYFDAYRIDHILGFFRIWEIPMHAVHGLLGQFVPSLPMSKEEIEDYGLAFDKELFLKPYIHEHILQKLFGPHTEQIKETFLLPSEKNGGWQMRPQYDTQRKVEACFRDKADNDSLWIRDGLYTLISNVLFIRDSKDADKYHPRIAAQRDFMYQSLSETDKAAFNQLYEQYYYHRHNEFWYQQAMKKLPQLTQSTRMLVCGEDLGMIPGCVSWVMNELKILSLEIQRMPKDPASEFGNPNEYPYRSVCTFSTHDMSTLRGWWKEDSQQTQRYYNTMLGHYGAAPSEATKEMCEEVIKQQLHSNSILSIMSFQDWLSIDEHWRNPDIEVERINIPSSSRHYWRYRMHLTLEELLKADSLNSKIRELIKQAGRNPEK